MRTHPPIQNGCILKTKTNKIEVLFILWSISRGRRRDDGDSQVIDAFVRAVDRCCHLTGPNRTRIDFGGGHLVGGVDQRVVAMVGVRVKETETCFAFAHKFGSPVVPHWNPNTRAR